MTSPWTWRPRCSVAATRIFSIGKVAAIGTASLAALIALVIRSSASGAASAPAGGVHPAGWVRSRRDGGDSLGRDAHRQRHLDRLGDDQVRGHVHATKQGPGPSLCAQRLQEAALRTGPDYGGACERRERRRRSGRCRGSRPIAFSAESAVWPAISTVLTTSSTTPASSWPKPDRRMYPNACANSVDEERGQSIGLRPAAATRTRTSRGLGCGSRRKEHEPNEEVAARIVIATTRRRLCPRGSQPPRRDPVVLPRAGRTRKWRDRRRWRSPAWRW
jgi:hypothetical protein